MTADAQGLTALAGWADWVGWAGQHGLALYLAMLAALLLLTGLAARGLASPPAAAAGAGPPAGSAGLQPVAIGLAVIVVAAAVFATLAWQLAAYPTLDAADRALLAALGPQVPTAVRQVFAGLTHAADTATLTGLCIIGTLALLLRRQPVLAAGWVLAIAGNGVLNTGLKLGFGRLRPPPLDGALAVPGLSFPSGHSSGALVAYGLAAYLALRLLPARWHQPALLLAVALAFSVGVSRVMLQVHFASDVLAGFASGSAWLALCIGGLAWLQQRGLGRHGRAQQSRDASD